jgi:hypothetical protein
VPRRIDCWLDLGRAELRLGDPVDAARDLTAALREAAEHGFVVLRLEAELAAASLPGGDRARLTRVAGEARAAGCLRLARLAETSPR